VVKIWKERVGVLALWMLGALMACSDDAAESKDPAYARGQNIYRNVCIACHHANPSQPGIIGPAIANASLELLEAKVLRGEYPEGYTPQRSTKQMPPLQYLEANLGDLAAYLAGREGLSPPATQPGL
jgi:mono/diheme cytochrome c family protein